LCNALEEFNDFKYKAYALAIQIGYYTGLRISEVLALNKDDINFEHNEIYVNKKLIYKGLRKNEYYALTQMKSKKSKAILPLTKPLKRILIEWFQANPYEKICCDIEGYYLNPNVFSSIVKKVSKKMGIDFNFHMLRHTFATNLVTNDVDLKTAQDLMRHSSVNTTMSIYTHIKDEHKLDVINNVFNIKSVEKVSKMN